MSATLLFFKVKSTSRLSHIAVFSVLLLLGEIKVSQAQVNSYTFSTSTGNVLETGGFTNLLNNFLDDDVSAMANIGFTFRFAGTNYTNFSVTSNGLMQLGGSAVTDYNNVTGNLTGPYLIPYWDDNYTDADGNVQYKVMGVAGSRKLVVEFNLSYLGNTGAADKRFQVWLFETTNRVHFVYGAGNNFNGGYSIGILTNGLTDFISVSVASNTRSIVTANDNNTTWPGSGRAYSFINSNTLPVTLLNFSGYRSGSRNQLQWTTVTEINNQGFELQRSADGNNFTTIDFIQSQSTGGNSNVQLSYLYTDNSISTGKHYYRLRQLDIDGQGRFSNVIKIDGQIPSEVRVDGVFPNPVVTNTLNLQLTSPNRQSLAIYLYDMSGRIVLSRNIPVETGSNTIPVDISQAATNLYQLKIMDSRGYNCGNIKVSVVK